MLATADPSTTFDALVADAADAHPLPSAQAHRAAAELAERLDLDPPAADAPPAVAQQPRQALSVALRDRFGDPWDPTQHSTPPDITARGTWRKLPRGAAPPDQDDDTGSAESVTPAAGADPLGPESGGGPAPDAQPIPVAAQVRHPACAWSEMFFATARMVLGPAWEPAPAERDEINRALARWMDAQQLTADLPPGWALVMAVGVYALPRSTDPETIRRAAVLAARFRRPPPPPPPPTAGSVPFSGEASA